METEPAQTSVQTETCLTEPVSILFKMLVKILVKVLVKILVRLSEFLFSGGQALATIK